MSDLKIATCCYCGTRAALTLAGRDRHELACRSCGAPMRWLKRLKTRQPGDRTRRALPDAARGAGQSRARPKHPQRKSRPGRRRGFVDCVLDEVWDEIEDIFD